MLLDDFQGWAPLSFYYELMISRGGPQKISVFLNSFIKPAQVQWKLALKSSIETTFLVDNI